MTQYTTEIKFTCFITLHNAYMCHGTLNHDGWVVTSDAAVRRLDWLHSRLNTSLLDKT